MSLQDFVANNNKDEHIFHSNAYAKVAQGGTLGSTNSQTFQQRQDMHRNRQEVRHYGASILAQSHMREEMQMQRGESQTGRSGRLGVPTRQLGGGVRSNIPSRPTFHEPPGRGYNPYG